MEDEREKMADEERNKLPLVKSPLQEVRESEGGEWAGMESRGGVRVSRGRSFGAF